MIGLERKWNNWRPRKKLQSLDKVEVSSNFSALLGGRRYSSGEFYDLSENGSYWSAAERKCRRRLEFTSSVASQAK